MGLKGSCERRVVSKRSLRRTASRTKYAGKETKVGRKARNMLHREEMEV
jgi:hypothetical protein